MMFVDLQDFVCNWVLSGCIVLYRVWNAVDVRQDYSRLLVDNFMYVNVGLPYPLIP